MNLIGKEAELLLSISKSQKLSARIVNRGKVLSYYLECKNKKKTHRDLEKSLNYVYKWVRRWESFEKERLDMASLYDKGELTEVAYQGMVVGLLDDKFRSGSPGRFTEIQRNQIVALGLEQPLDLGLPFTHWTNEVLANEVMKRGIVESISGRHLGRILKKSAVVPS